MVFRAPAPLFRRLAIGFLVVSPLVVCASEGIAQAQAAAPAAAATRVVGTVKAVSSGALTVTKDDGSIVTLTLADAVRVQQLPPGGTDLKEAQPATVSDIAEGDRVLVAAHPGDAGALNATRVVLMKSAAIAQTNASRQTDWQKRGSGGIVTAVDPSAKTITIAAGTRKTVVQTSDRTVFRRYAPGSVKFEDAKIGTLNDIAVGDQLRVRGSRDVDTGAIAADEVVSGAFRNVAGTVASVNAAANTVTVKDLATKKDVVITIGPETDLRALPAEMAARFAARARGGAAAAGAPRAAGSAGSAGTPASGNPAAPAATANVPAPSPAPASNSGDAATRVRPAGTSGSADLSQVVPHLPKTTLSALKPGEALMIVGSGTAMPGAPLTAITVLSGVEPLLAASPEGTSSFNLSPWSLSGGGEAAAGGATQ